MKKIIGLVILLAFSIGILWWVINRKSIIKKGIESAVNSKTDSIYKLSYDSSAFDELNGSAVLYNVSLKVDSSVLAKVILYDTVPGIILNIHIKSIAIQGLKSLKLLAGSSIDVGKITINNPQIILDKLAPPDNTKKKVTNDSVAVYKLLLGNFSFIRTKAIEINHASFKYNNSWQNQFIDLADLNISIIDFNIDKEHDYKQLIGYFVKNADVKLTNFKFIDSTSKQSITLDSLHYNSFMGELVLNGIHQKKQTIGLFQFSGLNTADFVYKKLFNSKRLTIRNIGLNMEQNGSSNKGGSSDSLSLSVNDILTAVRVDTLLLQNADVSIKEKEKETLKITGINAMLPKIAFDSVSIPVKKLLTNKEINFSFKSAFINPVKGLQKLEIYNVDYNGKIKKLSLAKLNVIPQYDKDEAMKIEGHPTDVFFVDMKNITVADCNVVDIFLNNSIAASSINASMDFKVYENHTLYDPFALKPTDYPQKSIGEAKVDIDIPLINLTNSSIIYEEKSHDTKLISQVAFYDASVQIRNIHNRKNLNQPMLVDIHSKFLNAGDFTTHWILPYGGQNFTITGKMGPMNLLAAGAVGRGMGSINIKSGNIDAFSFNISGSPTQAHGSVSAQYHDIKIDLLKMDKKTGDLEKKGFESFLGGLLLRKTNTNATPKEYDYKPRLGDSFFGNSWLAIFTGLKKIAM